MADTRHIGIAGAGLLGRLLAWQLTRAGHRVSVFDASAGPQPVPRSQAGEPYVPTAAAFTAAGMLSPLAELDNAEPAVAALGWRSLELWQQFARELGRPELVQVQGSLLVAHRHDLGSAQRVLDRLRAATATPEWQAASPQETVRKLDASTLRELEPSVQGPAHAWMLPGEGFIDPVGAMAAMYQAATGVSWHWGQRVLAVQAGKAGEGGGALLLHDGRVLAFDVVIDVRGVGAKAAASAPMPENVRALSAEGGFSANGAGSHTGADAVRGVRGEVIWLDCPGHGLQRPVRLLHPRHRVYIVPRSARDILVGASEIESEDRSPVSLRSATELMAAAHSVVPALAEARILKLDVNLRPAMPDNNPLLAWEGDRLTINGLFRHGWLLAPPLVELALAADGAKAAGLAKP